MDARQPVTVLEELLAAKGEHQLRTAVLMAGSQHDGEDLLQAAVERVFRKWRSISGDPEGYLRSLRLVPVREQRTRFTWLSPTAASLAQLTPPIPPGFRHVSG